MDYAISNWVLNTFGDSKFFAVVMSIFTHLGGWIAVTAILVGLVAFKKTRKVGLFCTVAVLLTLLVNNAILKNIVQRTRPFQDYPEMIKICELAGYKLPTDFSMASGHSASTMAVAVSVFMHSKKWGGVAIGGSVLIGLTRIALLVHYTTDVLVGWMIGAGLAIGVYFLLKFIDKKIQLKRGKI